MFLNSTLRIAVRSKLLSWIQQQQRNIRPTIKIGKEKFELTLDVRHFAKDELKVKARSEYVIVEGKQEKKTKNGYVLRQFVRKFKLPYGCSPETIKVNLLKEGVLKVSAPRQTCDKNLPCETALPISREEPRSPRDSLAAVQSSDDTETHTGKKS